LQHVHGTCTQQAMVLTGGAHYADLVCLTCYGCLLSSVVTAECVIQVSWCGVLAADFCELCVPQLLVFRLLLCHCSKQRSMS
jgi:hypothetical protein